MNSDQAYTMGCALAFAWRGHAVLLLYGISDGKCDCGKDCGTNAGKHPHHACPNGVHSATTDAARILVVRQVPKRQLRHLHEHAPDSRH